jgi:hypothetical protein
MKKALLALIALTSLNSFAIDIGCVTEQPTTTFIAETADDYVQFQLIHHHGVGYAPVWSSLITLNDIPTIQKRAELLAELGDYLKFSMPAKNCQLNGMKLNCFGSQPPIEMNGHKVSLWSVYTSEVHESSHAGDYDYITTNLALDIDGETAFVPMKYANYECYSGLKKKSELKKIFKL